MLGENILRLRKEANLSQEALGDIIGVTRQTISNWELEETAPNPEQLKLLSKAAFNCKGIVVKVWFITLFCSLDSLKSSTRNFSDVIVSKSLFISS